MKKHDWIEQFSRDIDARRTTFAQVEMDAMPEDYRQNLEVACKLAAIDLSDESQIRRTLQKRLLEKIDTKKEWKPQKENKMKLEFSKHFAALIVAVATVGIVVFLAIPSGRVVALKFLENVRDYFWVGPHTMVVVERRGAITPTPMPATKPMWIYSTEGISWGGIPFSGTSTEMLYFDNLESTQEAIPYSLILPEYLPEGYAFEKSAVSPDLVYVFLHYSGPGHEIVISEANLGHYENTAMATGTICPIENVSINGINGAWVRTDCADDFRGTERMLWESDGISFNLNGIGLAFEEAVRIAESMK